MRDISEKLKKILYIFAGTFFLVIGSIGIVIPVLPTTPFLLLAAACYIRGSDRLYHWLINNRIFGEFIRNYKEGKGITLRNKVITTIFLWITISYSALIILKNPLIQGLLFFIAIAVSAHIILLPTYRRTIDD